MSKISDIEKEWADFNIELDAKKTEIKLLNNMIFNNFKIALQQIKKYCDFNNCKKCKYVNKGSNTCKLAKAPYKWEL